MEFTSIEKQAVISLMIGIIEADSWIDDEEIEFAQDVLDAIEEALLSSDMGVETTLKLIENLEDRVEKDKYMSMDELVDILRDEIAKLLNVSRVIFLNMWRNKQAAQRRCYPYSDLWAMFICSSKL